jgi:hypothetical protein
MKSTEKNFEVPLVPYFGIDLARELGSMDSRLTRVENDIQKLDAKVDIVYGKLDAKIDSVDGRVDRCLVSINRMDERIISMEKRMDERINSMEKHLGGRLDSHRTLMFSILATVIGGFILQFFFK